MPPPIDRQSPSTDRLLYREISGSIINAFYATYDIVGYGYLERVYTNSLALELSSRGLRIAREVPIAVWFKGARVGHYRADLVVENCILVEVKASRALDPADYKQVLNYLRGTNLEVALLLHYGPKAAFQRIIMDNGRKPSGADRGPR